MPLKIDIINPGYGLSVVICLENKHYIIDGGSGDEEYMNSVPHRMELSHYLNKHNIDEVEGWIITHPHEDHIGAAATLMEDIRVKTVYMNTFLEGYAPKEVAGFGSIRQGMVDLSRLCSVLQANNIPHHIVKDLHTIVLGDWFLHLLTPHESKVEPIQLLMNKLVQTQSSESENSLLDQIDKGLNGTSLAVLLCKGEDSVALFGADASPDMWPSYASLIKTPHLVTAPHHGDIRYYKDSYLESIMIPHLVVIADSLGTFGFPSPDFLKAQKGRCKEFTFLEHDHNTGCLLRYNFDDQGVVLGKEFL
ncbi:ComEC/Rec2 family competence protein [Spirochaeta cellobiosiphila]|uniref:ComEC/Rec2 family competence protein n=1 Tax=Spirochaeta cellobiosiphila TaxID=504483 RepID=UPI000408476A|nr:MBL fold metallo-hydrolase [Spirochaeta cellobiosiphila]